MCRTRTARNGRLLALREQRAPLHRLRVRQREPRDELRERHERRVRELVARHVERHEHAVQAQALQSTVAGRDATPTRLRLPNQPHSWRRLHSHQPDVYLEDAGSARVADAIRGEIQREELRAHLQLPQRFAECDRASVCDGAVAQRQVGHTEHM